MLIIDHTAYPSILDDVLAHSSVSALLSFRATASAYKSRVDTQLFTHAVLVTRATATGVQLALRSASGAELPYLPHLVHILDIATTLEPTSAQKAEFTSLRTVRRFGSGMHLAAEIPSSWRAPTAVDFLTVDEATGGAAGVLCAPGECSRYVAHVAPTSDGRRAEIRTRVQRQRAREYVLVFWPSRYPPEHAPVRVITEFGLHAHREGSLTIVGVEDALPEGYGLQKLKTLVRQFYTVTLRFSDAAADVQDASTRWLSREEWWAELGARREVEGVWPGVGYK
ncbi:uncharacterized protein LOC62_04G005265 [Vanrija pseudolonga]|uniref:Uncharacterized protein n=1 Tax=Vanrija pseudolonga TaxID=143232 RepID=A0AAF0YDD5_9TREE|nr:hypothetical protein LOC62_04G005265 [Vanrija pseudolonga]